MRLKKVKINLPWIYVMENIYGEKIARNFYEKALQKTYQTEFRIEKVINKKR